MLELQFRPSNGAASEPDSETLRGSAWLLEDGLVATCLHCVSHDEQRWATDDEAGDYLLLDESRREIATLQPLLAIPSLDVALLSVSDKNALPPDTRLGPVLELSADWLPDGVAWHADVRPIALEGHGVRLSGTLARWAAPGGQLHQLTVQQGTDIDWASSSGAPVIHDDRVVGMLKGQLDAGNTCYAVPAYAVELIRWLARRWADFDELGSGWNEWVDDGVSPRRSDSLAELFAATGATIDALAAKLKLDLHGPAGEQLRALLADRPALPATSAEGDLSARALRHLRAVARPTSDTLLRMMFPSFHGEGEVFVPPRLRRVQAGSAAKQQTAQVTEAQQDESAKLDASIDYSELWNRLTQASKESAHRIAVLGEAGAGKSTLLREIAHDLLAREQGLSVQLHFRQIGSAGLLGAIRSDWLPSLGILGEAQEAYLRALRRLATMRRLWILVDGIDEVGIVDREPLEQISRGVVGVLQGAHVIVASRHAYWYHGTNELHGFAVYDLEEFSQERVFEVIAQWFRARPDVGSELAKRLRAPSRYYLLQGVRNPLRLAMLCAIWWGIAETNGAMELPTTRAELYESFLTLSYEWNAKRRAVGQVSLDSLADAISRLALHVLSTQDAASSDHSGAFDERVITASNPGIDAVLRAALVESGWLVRLPATDPKRRLFRFAHRTWLEYLAARGLHSHGELLDLNAPVPCARALEPRWREVALFWMGRSDVDMAQKRTLLLRMWKLRDGVMSLYADRALQLIPSCLRQCECLDDAEVQELLIGIVFHAVGRPNPGGGWLMPFPAMQAQACAALGEANPAVVAELVKAIYESARESRAGPRFLPALAALLVQAAGEDPACGDVAAHLYLELRWQRGMPSATPLLGNPEFRRQLAEAIVRDKDDRGYALSILSRASEESEHASKIALDLLHDPSALKPKVRHALLEVVAQGGAVRAPAGAEKFLELKAFGLRSSGQAMWLLALGAISSDPAMLADRVLSGRAWQQPWAQSRQDELLKILSAFPRVSESVALRLLSGFKLSSNTNIPYDAIRILHRACRDYPAMLSRFLGELHRHPDPRWIASGLQSLDVAGADDAARDTLRQLAQNPYPPARFEAARILLKASEKSELDYEMALGVLDALVMDFGLEEARRLETPWRAAGLLRAERLERPEFVARIVSKIKASQDEELWNAGGSCLGDVGLGSSVAANCLMDLIERDDIHPGIRDNIVRDLARVGSIGIDERERLVTIAASLKDQSGIRWLLDTMTTLGVDSDRAADIASDVALLPDQDGLTVRAALELLFTAERIRSRGRDLALRLLDMQGSGLTADVMNVLASKATPDRRLTLALLKRLDEERDAKALYPLERALDVQLAGRGQGELAVPALRRCMSDRPGDELAVERHRIAYEFLMDISSRTPYLVFRERWDAQGESA